MSKSSYTLIGILAAIVIAVAFWGIPQYKVYSAKLEGEAELKRAEQNRQIKIQEANAAKEAAKSLADAEITRAHGVAEANKIIGQSLKDNETYLHYLWLQALEHNEGDVIYIPTEANFPVMEAGRIPMKDVVRKFPQPKPTE